MIATNHVVHAYNHAWRANLPEDESKLVYKGNDLPPPFEAYGSVTTWTLESCTCSPTCDNCWDATLKMAKAQHQRQKDTMKKFAVLMGIQRNKKLATAFRNQKQKQKKALQDAMEEDDDNDVLPLEDESDESASEGGRASVASESILDDDDKMESSSSSEDETDDVSSTASEDSEEDAESESQSVSSSSSSDSEEEDDAAVTRKPKAKARAVKGPVKKR